MVYEKRYKNGALQLQSHPQVKSGYSFRFPDTKKGVRLHP